jgi:hypothetical protein
MDSPTASYRGSTTSQNAVVFALVRVYRTLCHGRSPLWLVVNFMRNFSLVFLWLCVFKNAGLIPIEWRPDINVTILRDADDFIFSGFSGLVCGVGLFALSYPIAKHLYLSRPTPYAGEKSAPHNARSVSITVSLLSTIWLSMNLAYLCINYIVSALDIMAWLSYVIGHISAPIITAVYLWLFAPPGICGLFGLALGLQNLAGVFTHLLFPTAPPWYNHLYGEQPGNYSIPGYAAGLTRVDIALGTHLHNDGFHMSPIVFGAFPSLHSAFVCLIFLFVSRYASWGGSNWGWGMTRPTRNKDSPFSVFSLLPLGTGVCVVYMVWQWWATMYLDHHYRLDLLGGGLYAIVAFFVVFRRMRDHEEDFQNNPNKTTGGMRLFHGTMFAHFFNSLANPELDDYILASPSSSELDFV